MSRFLSRHEIGRLMQFSAMWVPLLRPQTRLETSFIKLGPYGLPLEKLLVQTWPAQASARPSKPSVSLPLTSSSVSGFLIPFQTEMSLRPYLGMPLRCVFQNFKLWFTMLYAPDFPHRVLAPHQGGGRGNHFRWKMPFLFQDVSYKANIALRIAM